MVYKSEPTLWPTFSLDKISVSLICLCPRYEVSEYSVPNVISNRAMNLFIKCYLWIGLLAVSASGQTSDRRTDEWYKEEWPAQPYAFGYEIRDTSGNEQYRKEMSDGDRVTGSYGYLGPDGLYRHVEYIADINGFRAKIRTSEPGTANDNPSNVQIESNPVLVVSNPPIGPIVPPITPSYGDVSTNGNPIGGYRRDGLRPPPNRNPNPNRSTISNPSIPRIPEPPQTPDSDQPINRDRYDVNPNLGPEEPPVKPNFENPNQRPPLDDGRVGQPDSDIPDNVIPYRGANPKRPRVDDPPRDVPQFNNPRPVPGDGGRPPYVRPPYGGSNRSPAPPPHPNRASSRPYDRPGPGADSRGRPVPRPEDRRYEPTKGGSTKSGGREMGFIEATKGPVSSYRPIDDSYDQRPATFDDDSDYQFKRRQDEDRNRVPVNKAVFEDRVPPKKIGGFVRTPFNASRTDPREKSGTAGQLPSPVVKTTYNVSSNNSSFKANQDRRDGFDKKVRRPTKVFVTSGPISGIPHTSRPPIKADDRSFGAIDAHQRQHNNNGFDGRDGQPIGFGGVKGRPDRDQALPPTRSDAPQQDVKPFYGVRRDRNRDPVPTRPHSIAPSPRLPGPPYDPRDRPIEQNIQTLDDDTPIQRDDEFPEEYPGDGQQYPHDGQQIMPNHRPDRQPLPRRPDRPYKPRTQTPDKPYVEQQFEVQPYQTQNSASITSPVNTIASVYKPVDDSEDSDKPEDKSEEKPSFNTPLSPSSYKVTPFPVNETKVAIKPIIVSKPDIYTVPPELMQMEIPKFGTRLNTPEPAIQGSYKPIEQTDNQDDGPIDQQSGYDDQSDQNNDQNVYEYSDENDDQNQNQSPITDTNDNSDAKPNDNSNYDQKYSSQSMDSIDNDQYYAYYDESENIESRETTEKTD